MMKEALPAIPNPQNEDQPKNNKKRRVCENCVRPVTTCICSSLPKNNISLSNARVIVIQHPLESKRKNRSLPLIEMALARDKNLAESDTDEDFNFYKIVARYWGQQVVSPKVWKMVNDPSEPVLICFPSNDAIPIEDAIERILNKEKSEEQTVVKSDASEIDKETKSKRGSPKKKINIIFIDATWKYAKEMDSKTMQNSGWPSHVVKVKLSNFGINFQPRRFDIRAPPSNDHLCTAECIAQVLKIMEEDGEELFDTLMRPLDHMVQQWHSFSEKKKIKNDG
jgi:DTW domain-containing protein YfiP